MNQIIQAAQAIIAQIESMELLHVEADELDEMTANSAITTIEPDLALLHLLIDRFRVAEELWQDRAAASAADEPDLLQHAYQAYAAAASAAEPAEPARVRATDSDEMARLRDDNFVLRARMHAIALLSSEVSP